jgi:hypothetical protein
MWRWSQPRPSFVGATKSVFFDLGTEVLEAEPNTIVERDELERLIPDHLARGGSYVSNRWVRNRVVDFRGRIVSRNEFLARARLRAVDDEEGQRPASYLAHWHNNETAMARSAPRTKEFPTREKLVAWAARQQRMIYVKEWRGDGSVVEVRRVYREDLAV